LTPPAASIRQCRYALASALASVFDDSGRPTRAYEAQSEFQHALEEEGADPPDDLIHLATGRLLETLDPARALESYVKALSGLLAEEAAERGRALLAAASQPKVVIAALSPETIDAVAAAAHAGAIAKPGKWRAVIERVSGQTIGREPGQVALLAATLLRERGQDDAALELLRRTYADAGSRAKTVVAALAEALLDIDLVDDTLALVEQNDPERREPTLQVIAAEAYLIRGDHQGALSAADAIIAAGSAPPAAWTVRALSLVGLGRLDEALETGEALAEQGSEPDLARAVVTLQRRDYSAAGEASWRFLRAAPADSDALLLAAQIAVERLGSSGEGEESAVADSLAADTTPGAEIDAARRIVSELVAELPEQGLRSRWWRAQSSARRDDGRFRFFCAELRAARGEDVGIEELEIDGDVTGTQRAALAELKVETLLKAGDFDGATLADDEACRLFRDDAVDLERALLHVHAAYDRAPTARRAAELAGRTISVPDNPADATGPLERLEFAVDAVKRWLTDSTDDELAELVNLLAWLRVRLHGLSDNTPVDQARAMLPWLLVGVAVRPDDGGLRAVLSAQLTALGHKCAALAHAMDAYDAEPYSSYVIETTVVARANYYMTLEDVGSSLERYVAVGGDEEWANAAELHISLAEGDRERTRRCREMSLTKLQWASFDRAMATALLFGLEEASLDLDLALADALDEKPPAYVDAAQLTALLGRPQAAADHVAAARREGETSAQVLQADLIRRFAAGDDIAPDEFFTESLALCDSPTSVGWLVNVMLPLLTALRTKAAGPAPDVEIDHDAVGERLRSFGEPRDTYLDELAEHGPSLVQLALLADLRSSLVKLVEAQRNSHEAWPDELPIAVRERVAGIVFRRAGAAVPQQLVNRVLGRDGDGAPEDARIVLAGGVDVPVSVRLATALLADPSQVDGRTIANATDEDVSSAAAEIARVETPDDYWKLEALVRERRNDGSLPAVLHRVAGATVDQLGFRLDELLGLARGDTALEIAIVTPMVVEVGTNLVPLVDSSQDGGDFLERLIPAMRERIFESTGVNVPGVRLRGSDVLGPNEFCAYVDEAPALLESLDFDPSSIVPVASRSGNGASDGESPDAQAPLPALKAAESHPAAVRLVGRTEDVLRTHLARFLGPQEVDQLVDRWAAGADAELVEAVVPGLEARVRLTWVLQALVDDGVPVREWRTILTSIAAAGGIGMPRAALRRAVRADLREQLPGREAGRRQVLVPTEHEEALVALTNGASTGDVPNHERHDFMRWLRETIEEDATSLTLVTRGDDARELVSALVRSESPSIVTLSASEVAAE
jgi:hypothetical protein